MKYTYTYRTTAIDLWQLSMYYTYGSMVGVCNVIFTVALFILTATQWSAASVLLRCFMVLGCCLFTVIQPLLVYLKASRQAAGIKEDTTVAFDENGVHVTVGAQCSDTEWTSIKRISKKPTMIIVFADTTHGFILTDRILGSDKESFHTYVVSQMKRNSSGRR